MPRCRHEPVRRQPGSAALECGGALLRIVESREDIENHRHLDDIQGIDEEIDPVCVELGGGESVAGRLGPQVDQRSFQVGSAPITDGATVRPSAKCSNCLR